MKVKFLIVMLGIWGSTMFSQAQPTIVTSQENEVYISVGVSGGLNLSTILTESPIEADFGLRPGFNAGVTANFRFLNRNDRSSAKTGLLAIQPELRFATLGADSAQSDLSLGYLMIPVMFQIYPTKNFYIEIGPEFAFKLYNSPDHIVASTYQLDLTNFSGNDFMVGAGFGFLLGDFVVSARYNLGAINYAANLPWTNSLVQINVGYTFPLKMNKPDNDMIIDL